MASTDATASSPAPTSDRKMKPEKPDEEKYKADLAEAEKEHAAVMDRLVSVILSNGYLHEDYQGFCLGRFLSCIVIKGECIWPGTH